MKCPEWLLEAMRKGEGVKCWVWDDERPKEPDLVTVTGFDGDDGGLGNYYTIDGTWFANAELCTEPAHEFKPFEQVLVSDDSCCAWTAGFYSHFDKDPDFSEYPHVTCGLRHWSYCITYAGNEHLLGTTDSPKN
jgi:hypothetical protein